MGTPALLAGVLLLDPTLAVIAAALGAAISDGLQRSAFSRIFFNVGQATIQAFVAVAVLCLAGWQVASPD
jgi:hypothetical protein